MLMVMSDLAGFVKEAGSSSLQQELFKISDTALRESPRVLDPEKRDKCREKAFIADVKKPKFTLWGIVCLYFCSVMQITCIPLTDQITTLCTFDDNLISHTCTQSIKHTVCISRWVDVKGAIGDCLQKHILLCWLNVCSHPDSNHKVKWSKCIYLYLYILWKP